MSDAEALIRSRLANSYPDFARTCLRIRPKSGSSIPFIFNREQVYIHNLVRRQRAEKNMVRALVLKGRQQGVSTYVEGRAYWRTAWSRGFRAFILTHNAEATANLFAMAKRFHEGVPEYLRPAVGSSSQRELAFSLLDSGYKVGTAGTEGVGRSDTIQFFHGSEVAFWPDADSHMAGALQAVPDGNGTEIWLESTANGVGNRFHSMWQEAEAGQSEFLPIFIPWYWNAGYQSPVDDDLELSPDDLDYMNTWKLTLEQMAWRKKKMRLLGHDWLFAQEYPACPAEAFQNSGLESFIPPRLIMTARHAKAEARGPLVIGFDPNWGGDDRACFAWRQGRVVTKVEKFSGKTPMELVGLAAERLQNAEVSRMFIDVGGGGAVYADRLRELGHGSKLTTVNFGDRHSLRHPDRHLNKRAEMYADMREWMMDQPASIPNDDELHADLSGPLYSHDSLSRLKIESKDDMKKRRVRSPDMADAIALTFAYPVTIGSSDERANRYRRRRSRTSAWAA